MKLKKIASLALAGIMAASMLAGCNTGSSNTTGGTDTSSNYASIVDAVNNGQSIKNKVKVTFTYNTDLEDAANKAVALYQDGAGVNEVTAAIKQYMPSLLDAETTFTNFYDDEHALPGTKGSTKDNDGDTVTYFEVTTIGAKPASDAFLKNFAANHIDSLVAKLDNTNKVKTGEAILGNDGRTYNAVTKGGDHYQDYSYTGSVCVVEAKATTGQVVYYMATILTQTVTDHVLEK